MIFTVDIQIQQVLNFGTLIIVIPGLDLDGMNLKIPNLKLPKPKNTEPQTSQTSRKPNPDPSEPPNVQRLVSKYKATLGLVLNH